LSDAEIQRMKDEAAANAAADAKEKERIDKINEADALDFPDREEPERPW
jgi:molecular chaperone DnaK